MLNGMGSDKVNIIKFGNKNNSLNNLCVGEKQRTLVIAGIGTSENTCSADLEFKKAQLALDAGADMISDHSFFGDINFFQKKLISELGARLSVVASYELSKRYNREKWDKLDLNSVLSLIEEQISRGIDIITIHATLTHDDLRLLKTSGRIIPMSSKGGGIIADYMAQTGEENPYWVFFDEILNLVSGTGVAISLGTTFRPASVCDKWDDFSENEITKMGELVARADERNVPIIVEGLGHVSINEIESIVKKTKLKCHNAPYRILSVATDRAIGGDHISGAIAAAVAVANGANMIQAVSRKEHIGLPDCEDVVEAVTSAKIAAAVGELVSIGNYELECEMAKSRWENGCHGNLNFSINPKSVPALAVKGNDCIKSCSMCGDYCGLEFAHSVLKGNQT